MVSLSLSLSGGVGVVHAEGCGVEGGTAGGDRGLVEIGLIEMSNADGRMKDDTVEGGVVVSDVADGRNLPFSSHCVVLASVAGVRPARGR
jgi:hypothetical protein